MGKANWDDDGSGKVWLVGSFWGVSGWSFLVGQFIPCW